MKKLIQRKSNLYIRLLLNLLFALVFAFGVEAVYNISAIMNPYSPIELNQSEKDGKLILSKTLDQPQYVKKLTIVGSFDKRMSYTVHLRTVNGFGVKEDQEVTDQANAVFPMAVTNINKKISRIRVVLDKSDLVSVSSVSISNPIQVNGYRLFFFSSVFFIILLIFREKDWIARKLECFYLVAALCMGVLTIQASGPQAITWDEEVHYREAYEESFIGDVAWNQAAQENSGRVSIKVNTGEERILLEQYMDDLAENGEIEIIEKTGAHARSWLTYLPMSFMMKIGRLLPLSYSQQYALGRMGNLLCCVLMNVLTIYLAGRKKLLFTAVALLPTVLFQGCMYSYDGVIFSCMSLGTVLCCRFLEQGDRRIKIWQMIVPFCLFGIGIMAKPVYAPFLLFLLPLIKQKISSCSPRQKRICRWSILVGGIFGIIAVGVYLGPTVLRILDGTLSLPGDARGGETDAAAQLAMILKNPLAFLQMLIHEMFTMDNFRNFGDESLNHYMASNLMFLNLYVLGNLKDAWSFILLPLLGMIFLISPEKEEVPHAVCRIRWVSALVVLGSSILVWTAMYLFFTPVGMGEIEGVQARYFLPLIMPAAYLLWNGKLRIRITRERYTQIVLGITLMLTAVCFYQGVIAGRVG